MSPWQRHERIGAVDLYLGDCLEVMPTLEGVGAVVTDPPYGIGTGKRKAGSKGRLWGEQEWDRTTVAGFPDALASLDVPSIVWGGNYYDLPPSRCWLIWDKCQPEEWYSTAHFEMAWTNMDRNAQAFRMSQVQAYATMDKSHPSQKPVALMEWCLRRVPEDAVILDPFAGAGTTLVACAKLGRRGIGIELDPEYFEIACRRVEAAYRQPDLFVPAPPAPVQEAFEI